LNKSSGFAIHDTVLSIRIKPIAYIAQHFIITSILSVSLLIMLSFGLSGFLFGSAGTSALSFGQTAILFWGIGTVITTVSVGRNHEWSIRARFLHWLTTFLCCLSSRSTIC
jgi:hypothetical protein